MRGGATAVGASPAPASAAHPPLIFDGFGCVGFGGFGWLGFGGLPLPDAAEDPAGLSAFLSAFLSACLSACLSIDLASQTCRNRTF